ncbi:MAG: nitroreductase family protein, partial [Bacteroidota bacterium]
LSPSSINSQPWKFTFIQNEQTKKQLSEVSWLNTNKVLNCDTLVVFSRIDNISLFEKQISEELPEGAVNYFKEFIKPKSEEQIKAWFGHQLYLSLGIFLSACAEIGIDSTPMEGIEPENYNKILGLDNYHTMVAVAIGYRDEQDQNQPRKRPKSRRDLNKIIQSI